MAFDFDNLTNYSNNDLKANILISSLTIISINLEFEFCTGNTDYMLSYFRLVWATSGAITVKKRVLFDNFHTPQFVDKHNQGQFTR